RFRPRPSARGGTRPRARRSGLSRRRARTPRRPRAARRFGDSPGTTAGSLSVHVGLGDAAGLVLGGGRVHGAVAVAVDVAGAGDREAASVDLHRVGTTDLGLL